MSERHFGLRTVYQPPRNRTRILSPLGWIVCVAVAFLFLGLALKPDLWAMYYLGWAICDVKGCGP